MCELSFGWPCRVALTDIEASMDLSIVIPVYNEVESLPLLHQSIRTALKDLQRCWEVIYVDDGSRDGSVDLLTKLAAEDAEHVVVVEFRRNFGQTTAIAAGIDHALGDV